MYLLGHWATVCGLSWDLPNAVVACRQLGYSTALASVSDTDFGGHSDKIWSYEMHCNGYESNLSECARARSSCFKRSSGIARVVCSSEFTV